MARRAFATLDELTAVELDPDREVCPFCGTGYIVPGTAGERFGVCPKCYGRARNAAVRAAAEQEAVRLDYDVARAQASRAGRKGGGRKNGGGRYRPDFDALR